MEAEHQKMFWEEVERKGKERTSSVALQHFQNKKGE
jgi:hypothetical protein